MGYRATDYTPLNGVTSTVPAAKIVMCKMFQIARTDTTASVKAILPPDATVIDFVVSGAASNAATTATVSVGTTSTATEWINALDVKTTGGKMTITSALASSAIPNTEVVPQAGDILVYAKYAETGTASSSGGPYTVRLLYVR